MDAERARLAITLLDLTDLADDATAAAAAALCDRAAGAGVAAVCVWPRFVSACVERLRATGVRVATVVDFPSGDDPGADVVTATERALADGADEIDAVLAHRRWLAGDEAGAGAVLDGARAAVTAAGPDRRLKVIVESGELPDPATIDRAAHFAIAHGADFVKTSTGKTPVSATPEAAEIILEAIAMADRSVGFKASGGIRSAADAEIYLDVADTIMGAGWASPETFRFGASALLDALEAATR